MKISELTDEQKSHLVWRIDHKTGVGLITASRISKGEFGDKDLVDVFKKCGNSEHSAKIHARKVINFNSFGGCANCGEKGTNDQMTVVTVGGVHEREKAHVCKSCTAKLEGDGSDPIPCTYCGKTVIRGWADRHDGEPYCGLCNAL